MNLDDTPNQSVIPELGTPDWPRQSQRAVFLDALHNTGRAIMYFPALLLAGLSGSLDSDEGRILGIVLAVIIGRLLLIAWVVMIVIGILGSHHVLGATLGYWPSLGIGAALAALWAILQTNARVS